MRGIHRLVQVRLVRSFRLSSARGVRLNGSSIQTQGTPVASINPAPASGIIIISIPISGGFRGGQVGGGMSGYGGSPYLAAPKPQLPERAPMTGEAAAAASSLGAARNFFTKLGVGAHEGNDANLPVKFIRDFSNAAYMHGSDEAMLIGVDKATGTSMAAATDVVAHEYAHRVVDHILGQPGVGEAGVVNESLADTFAAAIDTKDWTIGEAVTPGGFRSMLQPARAQDEIAVGPGQKIPLPDNIVDYLNVSRRTDKGGVHLNVGIPNKAAALIGEKLGRDTMAQIYLDAIRTDMPKGGGIGELAQATYDAASRRFGEASNQTAAVLDAWKAVGFSSEPAPRSS